MPTEMCIDATCRHAYESGYKVTIVKDAHSKLDNGELSAAQIITQYNETLRAVVKLEEACHILFG